MEMRYYRSISRIPYTDLVINEEVRNVINQIIRKYEIVPSTLRSKRSVVLVITVNIITRSKAKRRAKERETHKELDTQRIGRTASKNWTDSIKELDGQHQRIGRIASKNWTDSIKEWTVLDVYETDVAEMDWQRWTHIVKLSSEVPQLPPTVTE